MSLMCGGRGPCCHVGYSHRHCEHCDTVIPISVTPHQHYGYPWYQGGAYGLSTLNGSLSSWGVNQFQQLANQLQSATEVPIDAGQQLSSS